MDLPEDEQQSSEHVEKQDVVLNISESDNELWDDFGIPLSDSNVTEQDDTTKENQKSAEEVTLTTSTECGKNMIQEVKRMQRVFGLLCMAFKDDPYEFTLATMCEYISGECDAEGCWLKNLDSYIEQLHITELYVLGQAQKSKIRRFIHNTPIYQLRPENFPCNKKKCPACFRFGCSKFKCESILRYNFFYGFQIPCSQHYFSD